MINPFSLGVANEKGFCNRENEIQDLLRHARAGHNVVLFSPRRYGKTSLVKRVLELLGEEGLLTVYVDLFPVTSERDLVSRMSVAVLKGIGRGVNDRTLAQRFRDLFKRLTPSIEVKPDGYSFSVKYDHTAGAGPLLEDILEGLYRYVSRKRLRACMALDEFQEITELPESKRIEGLLRSHIQFHTKVAYFFVGSRRRILNDMFTDKARPFYKSAFSYGLRKIPRQEFVDHVRALFVESGKSCLPEAAQAIHDLVEGYPYYVQKLASIAWDISEESCTPSLVQTAWSALLNSESMEFEGVWRGLTVVQRGVLKALAVDPALNPYAKGFLEKHGLTLGGTQHALKVLLGRDLIERDEQGCYKLTDPVMRAWLIRT